MQKVKKVGGNWVLRASLREKKTPYFIIKNIIIIKNIYTVI